jgi:hypothetical protein
MGIEGLNMGKPETYTSKTKCCIRCKHKSDHSHQDGLEIYCAVDGVPEPFPGDFRLSGFDEKYRKWCEWSVPRSVEPWGSCPRFEESAEVVEHEKKMEEIAIGQHSVGDLKEKIE